MVRIIATVAAIAVPWCDDFHGTLLTMARVALQYRVISRKRIVGFADMVEYPSRPTVRRMAPTAIISEPAGVKGIGVASRASARRIFEVLALVAGGTTDCSMQSDKWKSRQIVVECDFCSPTGFAVTVRATLSKRSVVRILPPMATATGCC